MGDMAITFVASVLIWLMFLGLIILWLIDGKIKKELVLHAFVASLIAWISSLMFKDIFHTTRPYLNDGVRALVFWIPTFENGAFPSSHAAASFALSTTIWLHEKKIGTLYIIGSVLICIARVLAHVHYPLDVLGGTVLGILIAYLVEKTHFKFKY